LGGDTDILGNTVPENLGTVEALNRRQLMSDETKAIKERGDTKLSAAILGRHLTVYRQLQNFCVVLKSIFCE
jgi:hypothetical protein